jgi:hypothetical protein
METNQTDTHSEQFSNENYYIQASSCMRYARGVIVSRYSAAAYLLQDTQLCVRCNNHYSLEFVLA